MATQRSRYEDAQTVSDEHGKGAEVLRQQLADHFEPSSPGASLSSNHHIMYCEVDVVIRYIRTMSVDIPDANADLTVYRNRLGTIAALMAARAVDGNTTEIFIEEALTVANNFLRKNDSVYGIMVRDVGSTESADWAVYFGWMPNIHELDSDHRTF